MSAKEAWKKLQSQIDCGYYLTKPEFDAIEKAIEPAPKKPVAKKKPASKK